ncbi:MAG: hypothetical protein KDD62_10100, partial [Bdellovibrionales bacterium]|nr:hypothetical protein [Bdellovibrionales bacterium]
DPFANYVSGSPTLIPNMSQDSSTGMSYDGSEDLVTPERLSALYQSADRSTGNDDDVLNLSGIPDYEEMLVACANPLVLARNAFLSSLLEYAIRFGRTRSSVEVLHIGTQHRVVANAASLPSATNGPVIMVPFGADLLNPLLDSRLTNFFGSAAHAHFQLPYIFFDSGTSANPPPTAFGHHKNGYIQPFASDDTNPGAWKRHQALIANQLRMCYHLYQCDTNSGSSCGESIARYYPNVYFQQLESLDYESRSDLYQLPTAIPRGYWEQLCPFASGARDGSGSNACKAGGGNTLTRKGVSGLQGPELVSILGTTQLCPYRHYQSSLFVENGAGGVCQKPGYAFSSDDNYTLDLRPDYLGLMQYLSGSKAGVRSPGIAPLKTTPTLDAPMVAQAYRSEMNTWLPLVVVTHQLPTAAEASAIQSLITGNSRWLTRPVSVVFFPYREEQFRDTEGMDRLVEAFMLDSPDYLNSLFVFDPQEAGFDRTADGFRRYWESLIDPSLESGVEDSDSIAWRAARIFNQLLAKNREKL